MRVCLHVCMYTRLEEGVGSPGPGVRDGYVATMCAGNWPLVLYKNCTYTQPLRHLCSANDSSFDADNTFLFCVEYYLEKSYFIFPFLAAWIEALCEPHPWPLLCPPQPHVFSTSRRQSLLCSQGGSGSLNLSTSASGIAILTTMSNLFLYRTPGIVSVVGWLETHTKLEKEEYMSCMNHNMILEKILFYIYGCFSCNLCMCVHIVHEVLPETREGARSPETTDSHEPPVWEDAENWTQVLWKRNQWSSPLSNLSNPK